MSVVSLTSILLIASAAGIGLWMIVIGARGALRIWRESK